MKYIYDPQPVTNAYCCWLDPDTQARCDTPPLWRLTTGPGYEDGTDACPAHVAALLGDQPMENVEYLGARLPSYLDILFDGPPSHESGRFVEVEGLPHAESTPAGTSAGTWIQDGDLWRLRIPVPSGTLVG